ncbi:MAG: insulinase family protein [Clostridia bacterium]|nr:insulinase family protein [Clostridia bacterium]
MNFTVNQVIGGFTVKKIEYVKELDCNFIAMEHEHSGAKLVYIDRDDVNKVFGIAFKTVPEDSTGVFHILEHCMLNGSEKYPLREPFVNLLKNSLQTFLNAMTYPDKTVYPVASRNEKDFTNLMSVYLDAVFAPNLRTNKNVFLQEGWHYELEEADADPVYKGVVFNEMKGAMSSVFDVLERDFMAALYPDTCYAYNSGGEPSVIPELTYEQFLASYHKHYYADNAAIFLYGQMNLEEKLSFIDREYLSKFAKSGNKIEIQRQAPIVNLKAEGEYAIGEEDDEKDNAYCQLGWCIGEYDEREKLLAFEILNTVLLSTNDSPLKKAIMQAGLGQDVKGMVLTDVLQPAYLIQLHKTNPGEGERFYEVVKSTLESLVQKGLDKKTLEAAINNLEFKLREMETGGFPQGVLYGLNAASAMVYGGDPALYIRYEGEIETFRREMANGYFEKLIEENLLKSNHYALLTIKPSKTLGARQAAEEKAKCKAYKESLTKEGVEELLAMNRALRTFQETEDTPEQLATLPTLSLADLDREPTIVPTQTVEKDGRKLLFHKVSTGGIVYLTLYYNVGSIPLEQMPLLAMKVSMLGKLRTARHTAEELNTEVRLHMGDLSFGTTVFSADETSCMPMVMATCSYIEGQEDKALSLLRETLETTVFEEEEVQKLLAQKTAAMQMRIMQAGHVVGMTLLASRLSVKGVYQNEMGGIGFYRALKKMTAADLVKAELPFLSDNLTISVTGSERALSGLSERISSFERADSSMQTASAALAEGNEAIGIPAGVSYVCKGASGFKGQYKLGVLKVMAQILNLDYLWNEVRAKGGAYGVGIVAEENNASFYSYRDPNVERTLNAYDGGEAYLSNLSLSESDLTGYIIGTVAGEEPTLSPRMQASMGDRNYFENVTPEKQRQTREELLSTTLEDLRKTSSLIRTVKEEKHVAAVGNQEKLKESGAFDEIVSLS